MSTAYRGNSVRIARLIGGLLLLGPGAARAQQFYSDNQWVAPHGVATLVATVGEEYSQAYLTAALFPEWEFNLQLTHYYDDPRPRSGSYTATNLYVKHRLLQNDAETGGYGIMAGTGLFPEHLAEGEVSTAFQSWWGNGIATYPFFDNTIALDLFPGFVANLDQGESGETTWGFTYGTRLAIYDVIPSSAIVSEVFGTAGEAYAKPSYRLGVRWESPRLILAGTYSNAFDGSGGAGFEIGVLYLTGPHFCLGGCREE